MIEFLKSVISETKELLNSYTIGQIFVMVFVVIFARWKLGEVMDYYDGRNEE